MRRLVPARALANGSVELLNEVATSKITGEEDRYSHTDLSDFQGNLEGARVAFDLLRPALAAEGDKALANTIAQRFAVVQRGLDKYRRHTPLGFAYYGALTPADRLTFAREVDALAEPLSTVAAKVSGSSDDHAARVHRGRRCGGGRAGGRVGRDGVLRAERQLVLR